MLLARTGAWPERILVDVGVALHEGRTTALTDEGETYDDCVGVDYAPLDVETCGYRIVAKPRRIGVREVAEYASASCKRCHGLGYWAVQRTVQTGTDESGCKVMQEIAYEQSCGCADKQYRDRHPRMLIDSQLGEWIALDDLRVTDASTPESCALGGEDVIDLAGQPLTKQDLKDAYEQVTGDWPGPVQVVGEVP